MKTTRYAGGYSLIELIIGLVLIAIISSVAIATYHTMNAESKKRITRQNLGELKKAIIGDPAISFKGYRQITGRVPTALSELWDIEASAANLYLERGQGDQVFTSATAGNDAWGNQVEWDPATRTLRSLGADGQVGGTGDDADISLVIPDN